MGGGVTGKYGKIWRERERERAKESEKKGKEKSELGRREKVSPEDG